MSPPSMSGAAGPQTPPGDEFELQVMAGRGEVLIRLEGELDAAAAPEFVARFTGMVSTTDRTTVRLDLSRLLFLDVAGARALLQVGELLAVAGSRLKVHGSEGRRLPVVDYMGLRDRLVLDLDEVTPGGS